MKFRLSPLLFLLLAGTSMAAPRECSDIWCAMCARLNGMPAQLTRAGYVLVDGPGYWGSIVHRSRLPQKPKPQPAKPAIVINPSPQAVVEYALQIIQPEPHETLVDCGCGDGRVVEAAVARYGCWAIGVEIRPEVAKIARERLVKSGADKRRWLIETADATKHSYGRADIAWLYLYRDVLDKLLPALSHCRAVVSVSHEIPDAERHLVDGKWVVWIRMKRSYGAF